MKRIILKIKSEEILNFAHWEYPLTDKKSINSLSYQYFIFNSNTYQTKTIRYLTK